jgi:hypothetical protein
VIGRLHKLYGSGVRALSKPTRRHDSSKTFSILPALFPMILGVAKYAVKILHEQLYPPPSLQVVPCSP